MQSRGEGLLKVFVSSTFRDLQKERNIILDSLKQSLFPLGMEFFIPDGNTSQEIALLDEKQGLINTDLAIFLISPYYGSLIENCTLKENCKADCPLKFDPPGKISYTHCEYKFAKAEKIPFQLYLYNKKGWNAVQQLKTMNDLDWRLIRSNPIFEDFPDDQIEHFFAVKNQVLGFKQEIEKDFSPTIESDQLSIIANNLADIIVKWYHEGAINFQHFCGRRKDLEDLILKLNDSVEVYGVGGIGKTTLIHIVLLLQKLKGKKIISIGKKQSYLSGSGYSHFKEKCLDDIYEITTNRITINDVIEALKIGSALKIVNNEEKIQLICNKIEHEDLLIFIDDFHLADDNVRKLVANSKGFIIASKSNTGICKNQLQLIGIEEDERYKLVDIFSHQFGKTILTESKEKIGKISEGHPITIELLVRNFDKIDFKKLDDLKNDALIQSNPLQVDEFINRVIKDILSDDGFQFLKILSVINTEIETNIDKKTIIRTIRYQNPQALFNELIDTGLIKKKEKFESAYQFSFKHIQETMRERNIKLHHVATNYYKNKFSEIGRKIDDEVELLYHNIYANTTLDYSRNFLNLAENISPIDYNYKRLIEIGLYIKKGNKPENQSYVCNQLGIMYMELHRYKEAKDIFNLYIMLIEKLYVKNSPRYYNAKRPILINLGNLYYKINKFNEAENCYLEAKNISETILEKNSKFTNKHELMVIIGNLANVQKVLEKYEEAEKNYKRYLNFALDIAKKKKILYSETVAKALNNLGGLYVNLGRYAEAEKSSKESIEITSHLIKTNPNKYEPLHYQYLGNLGRIHLNLERFEEAEKELMDAYQKLKIFFNINKDAYCQDLVLTFDALVALYSNLHQVQKAEQFARESEKFKDHLVTQCSYAYLPSLASTYRDLGNICIQLNKPSDSLDYLSKSHSIIGKLLEKEPVFYLSDLAILNIIKGSVFLKLHQYELVEKAWNDSLNIFRNLYDKNEEAYLPSLAIALNHLGYLSLKLKRFDESKKFLTDCLEYRRKLAVQCPDANLGDLLYTLNILGNLYSEISQKEEAEKCFKEAEIIGEWLIISKKAKYNGIYAETLHNFGVFHRKNANYEPARKKLTKAIEIRRELAATVKELYLIDFIETLQECGKLYIKEDDLDNGEKCLIASLVHLNVLLLKSRDIFNPCYAESLTLLGQIYLLKKKIGPADENLKKALFIRKMYYEKYPAVFKNELIETLKNVQSLYEIQSQPQLVQETIDEIEKVTKNG